MSRFLFLMLCALTLLSLGAVSSAHAVEKNVCVEVSAGDAESHGTDTKGGQPDTEKSYPHQHGCHGHHFAAFVNGTRVSEQLLPTSVASPRVASELHPTLTDPALRPPQA